LENKKFKTNLVDKYLGNIIDDLQLVIDKHELSSEVHMLVKINHA